MTSPIRTVDGVFTLLAQGDTIDDDEAVDLLAHSLQCAALLAVAAPDDLELQIAGLVHDIGTLVPESTADTHAVLGATAIADVFGDRVGRLVALHDVAKCYLVTVEPNYRRLLSERSVATLHEQGGLMDAEQRRAFESAKDFSDLLTLRRADDAAKQSGLDVGGLERWRDAAESVAATIRV